MKYFALECEAPGHYGPSARIVYDKEVTQVIRVDFLDLEFEVWLGSEFVQHVQHFCVTERLWKYLLANGLRGVCARDMAVTPGEPFRCWSPGVELPVFKELMLVRTAKAEERNEWVIDRTTIPDADMFTGNFTALFVTERAKGLIESYSGTRSVVFQEAKVSE